MARNISNNARRSAFDQTTGTVWLTLLTLTHPELSPTLRFVANNESVVSRGDTFVAFPFEIELPSQDSEGPGECKISIDNVDQQIVAALRQIHTPIEVKIEIVLSTSLDTVEVSIPELVMRDVEWDVQAVRGTLRFEDVLAEPIGLSMTPARFPGLF